MLVGDGVSGSIFPLVAQRRSWLCFLHLNPRERRTIRRRDVISTFDFIGPFLVTAGIALLLIGFQGTQTSGWDSTLTIASVGGVLFISAGFYEYFVAREPVHPLVQSSPD